MKIYFKNRESLRNRYKSIKSRNPLTRWVMQDNGKEAVKGKRWVLAKQS